MYVVVQGRKQLMLGDETYVYDCSQYLAVSVDLPVVGNVFEASPEEPYLCMTLTVDPRELASLIVETGRQAPPDDHDGRALYLSPLRAPLSTGFSDWCGSSMARRHLGAGTSGPTGDRLPAAAERAVRAPGPDGNWRRPPAPSLGAIVWIKDHFAEPLQIEALANGCT